MGQFSVSCNACWQNGDRIERKLWLDKRHIAKTGKSKDYQRQSITYKNKVWWRKGSVNKKVKKYVSCIMYMSGLGLVRCLFCPVFSLFSSLLVVVVISWLSFIINCKLTIRAAISIIITHPLSTLPLHFSVGRVFVYSHLLLLLFCLVIDVMIACWFSPSLECSSLQIWFELVLYSENRLWLPFRFDCLVAQIMGNELCLSLTLFERWQPTLHLSFEWLTILLCSASLCIWVLLT